MLFTKEIGKIMFSDIKEFCYQQYRKEINLDRTRNIDQA
jgi:hypothetical protein